MDAKFEILLDQKLNTETRELFDFIMSLGLKERHDLYQFAKGVEYGLDTVRKTSPIIPEASQSRQGYEAGLLQK